MRISSQGTTKDTAKPAHVIDLDAFMRANMNRVFNERNVGQRLAALGELYSNDATLYDPEAVVTGREAISAAVDSLLGNFPPDYVFTAAGPAVGHNGAARLFWRLGPPGKPSWSQARTSPSSYTHASSACTCSSTRSSGEPPSRSFGDQMHPRRR
jgi:hypothetical protein